MNTSGGGCQNILGLYLTGTVPEREGERGVPGDRILCALLIRLISDGDMITVTTSASASTSGQFQNRYLPAFG